MQDKIQSFLHSLQLVPSQHTDLITRLESAQNGNGSTIFSDIGLACHVAQVSLGSGSVEAKPVNQTEADLNWSVIPQCSELPNTNFNGKGLKHVGQRHHA